jgi:AcrR family transcriptional regulator
MGVAERRAREKEAVRQRILDAAGKLFVEEGYQNVSIRKIAERAEYSPATLYLYFKDKDELLGNLCAATFEELIDAMEELKAKQLPPLEALREAMRYYIQFGVDHPNHYLITFAQRREPHPTPEGAAHFEEASTAGLAAFDGLRQVVKQCMDSGDIPAGHLDTTTQLVWMFLHGVASLLITAYPDPDFPWVEKDHLIQCSVQVLIAGLRCGAVPTPLPAVVDPGPA